MRLPRLFFIAGASESGDGRPVCEPGPQLSLLAGSQRADLSPISVPVNDR